MPITLKVNGEDRTVDVDPRTPLLWVLRDALELTGTKFGCGIAECGACTVHLDGQATPSCVLPVSSVGDREVTTIEGLPSEGLHPVQRAWVAEEVPQCGYCQPGIIMSVAALLDRTARPTDSEIDTALRGHICRCGTYPRIRRAIRRAGGRSQADPAGGPARGGTP